MTTFTIRRALSLLLAAVIAAVTLAAAPAAGAAQARVVGVREISPRVSLVSVYSPAMKRVVSSHVLHPAGKPAGLPSFYLLPGAGGAEDGISWYNHGGVKQFFAGKRVNVVLPIGGRFSMMTDWQRRDPLLGVNEWQSFFTRELPEAIDRTFRTSGVNALGGMFGGNVLEAIALSCTTNMSNKLRSLGIGHRFNHRPDGTHSWGLFAADMRLSWPMIARAIGA